MALKTYSACDSSPLLQAVPKGTIPIPLTRWRSILTNNIATMTDTPDTDNKFGGLLHPGSDPILHHKAGDTDSAFEIRWSSSTAFVIAAQAQLPIDFDPTKDLVFHFRAAMAGTTDTPAIDADVFFNEGDTKIEVAATVSGTAFADYTITIPAADIPSGAQTVSIELEPAAHTSDHLFITATWFEYTRGGGLDQGGISTCHVRIPASHKLREAYFAWRHLSQVGTMEVYLKRQHIGDSRGGATVGRYFENDDFTGVTADTYQQLKFDLASADMLMRGENAVYFLTMTGTLPEDRIVIPELILVVDEDA